MLGLVEFFVTFADVKGVFHRTRIVFSLFLGTFLLFEDSIHTHFYVFERDFRPLKHILFLSCKFFVIFFLIINDDLFSIVNLLSMFLLVIHILSSDDLIFVDLNSMVHRRYSINLLDDTLIAYNG